MAAFVMAVSAAGLLGWMAPAFAAPPAPPVEEGAAVSPSEWSGELEAGATDTHEIPLPAGYYMRVVVEPEGGDFTASWTGPDGRLLLEASTVTFPAGPRALSVVSDAEGLYRLRLRLDPGPESARYRVRIEERRLATPDDAQRVAAEQEYGRAEAQRQLGTADSLGKARSGFEAVLQRYRQLGEGAGEADAMTGLARVQDALGEKAAAREAYEGALQRQLAADRPRAAGYVLNYAALVEEHLGTRSRALEELAQALELARRIADRRLEGITLNSMGLVHYQLGDKSRALEFYEQALAAHRTAGNARGEAATLNGIGTVRDSMGQRAQGLQALHEALEVHRRVGDPRDIAIDLNTIGAVHAALDEPVDATDDYTQALEAWRRGGDRSGEAATLQSLARMQEASGEYQQAIALYGEALKQFRTTASRVREANTLLSLGRLYAGLGDQPRAQSFLEEALAAQRAAGSRAGEAAALTEMGALRTTQGDAKRGLELLEQALALRRRAADRLGEAATLLQVGRALASLGRPLEAFSSFATALTLYRQVGGTRGQASALAQMASARAALGEGAAAADLAREAVALCEAAGDRRGTTAALYELARIESDLDQLEPALAHLDAALATVESLRSGLADPDLRSSFLATLRDVYELEIDVLMQLDRARPDEGFAVRAFHLSERAHARSLLDLLAEGGAGLRPDGDAELVVRERRLRQRLNAKAARQATLGAADSAVLAKQIDALSAELRALQSELRVKNPRYAALTQPQPLDWPQVQSQILDADTVLVEYVLGDRRSYVWAGTREGLLAAELPARAVIEAAAQKVHGLASARDGAEPALRTAAAELGEMILAPVKASLGRKRLALVADGALEYLPFAALPDPLSRRGEPLGRRELVQLPSASALAVLRGETESRPGGQRLVAVLADPVFSAEDSRVGLPAGTRRRLPAVASAAERAAADAGFGGGRLPRLPATRREAAAIIAAAPPHQARAALDFEASRRLALDGELQGYRIVHFATHSLLDNVHPELSGVVLSLVDASGRAQEGYLRLDDVFNLRLPVDLVVLSACRTALGRELRGEGLMGLTRGFLYAGAKGVVASLWTVDDRATAELMGRFYRALLGPEHLRPAAALRVAQDGLRGHRRWSHPYYWAGFVLQGEWR